MLFLVLAIASAGVMKRQSMPVTTPVIGLFLDAKGTALFYFRRRDMACRLYMLELEKRRNQEWVANDTAWCEQELARYGDVMSEADRKSIERYEKQLGAMMDASTYKEFDAAWCEAKLLELRLNKVTVLN